MIVRGNGLEATMSRYLIDRIQGLPNVEVVTQSQITKLTGENGILESVCWSNRAGTRTERPVRHLFLFIGAEPNTDWLSRTGIARDNKGFILTNDATGRAARNMETSIPGIFAVGDVRSGSTKRVAAGVGEGAQVVATIHAYLASIGQ
jgi:thioredoxin reductase (NADPH)